MATVADLIKYLEQFPQDIEVAYELYSDQYLLEFDQLKLEELCEPRSDGWVQNKRPDKPTQTYLVFPGN